MNSNTRLCLIILVSLFTIPISTLVVTTTAAATTTPPGTPFVLPLAKDADTLQYYTTTTQIGTPSVPVNLTIDLTNRYTWLACDDIGYTTSSTYSPIRCDTPKCTSYNNNFPSFCFTCDDTLAPSCPRVACWAYIYSRFTQGVEYPSGLITDKLSSSSFTYSSHGQKSTTNITLPAFTFGCANPEPLIGLSPHSKGIMTLSRTTPMAMQFQASETLNIPRKFALCLASRGGIQFGGGPYNIRSNTDDLSKFMVRTPLVPNPHSTDKPYLERDPSLEYFISVQSIEIDAKAVRGFNRSLLVIDETGNGGVGFSTMEPYTKLKSEIYKAVVEVFVAKLTKSRKVVGSVAPFGACFSSIGDGDDESLPVIDLVFGNVGRKNNKGGKWRIYGSNSMVKVSRNVSCLGFVDAGMNLKWPATSVVIGGRQMEDNLIEFDLESSMFGVTSSLKRVGTSCSNFIK